MYFVKVTGLNHPVFINFIIKDFTDKILQYEK
jgi:hypothetical protein